MLHAKPNTQQAAKAAQWKTVFREIHRLRTRGFHVGYTKIGGNAIMIMEKAA